MMKQDKFPPGWDTERVQKVIAHYESQTEDEAVAEDEAAFQDKFVTKIVIPMELVSVVRELISRHKVQGHQQNNKILRSSKEHFVFGPPRSTEWASMGYLAREIEATEHGKQELRGLRSVNIL